MHNRQFFTPFEQEKKRFGELMLDSYYLSKEELEELLDEQRFKPGTRLGYMCLEKGYAEKHEVMDVLMRQLPISVPYSLK